MSKTLIAFAVLRELYPDSQTIIERIRLASEDGVITTMEAEMLRHKLASWAGELR